MVSVSELHEKGLAGGVEEFANSLGKIHLPANPQQRPDKDFVRLANEYRGLG